MFVRNSGACSSRMTYSFHVFLTVAVISRMAQMFAQAEKHKGKKFNDVEQKDFPWDLFMKYISSSILALTFTGIFVNFFMEDNAVSCFPPSEIDGRPSTLNEASFIDQHCANNYRIMLRKYFPIYLLVQGLVLIIPHYMWSSVFERDFDTFLTVATKIDCLRDNEIGEYSEKNFSQVKKLERKYNNKGLIFISYMIKSIVQLLFSLAFIVLNIVGILSAVIQEPLDLFEFSFDCNVSNIAQWPEITVVPCVYSSLRLLEVSLIIDLILTILFAGLSFYGFSWCLCGLHGQQIGYCKIAEFAFQSLLEPDSHVSLLPRRSSSKHHKGRIEDDLDFLSLVLDRSDRIYGDAFRDILVS